MRLLALELQRYGAFADRTLRFRPQARAHIVFGPNEAGKSTALAAAHDLLFGIDDMRHAFLHRGPELRIRGEIHHSGGQKLEFVRRKGNKSKLLDLAGAALPDDALAPFLGSLTRDIFARAFGLNAQALRAGADELLKSRGDVGHSLIAAAAGTRGLCDLRKSLDAEAERIFAPRRAGDRAFYQAMDRYEEARKAVRERELRASDWKRLEDDIAERMAALDDIKARRTSMAIRIAKLDRLRRLSPRLAAIDQAAQALDEVNDASGLPLGFGARLGEAMVARSAAAARYDEAEAKARTAGEELAAIGVDDALLARADDIAALFSAVGKHQKDMQDRPRVHAEAEKLRDAAMDIAARLGLADLADLGARRPTDATLAEARALIRDGEKLEHRRATLAQSLAEEDAAILRYKRDEMQGLLVDPAPLKERFCALGDIAARMGASQAEGPRIAAEERAIAEEAARLNPAAPDLDRLATATLPDARACAKFSEAFRRIDEDARDARKDIAAAQEAVTRAEELMRELTSDGAPPTPERIAVARAARDAAWASLRARLFDEDGALAGSALARKTATFETASKEADLLADAAACDADRVSRCRGAEADAQRQRMRIAEAQARRAEIAQERTALEARWRSAWRDAAIEPLGPAEMPAWLTSVRALFERRAALVSRRAEFAVQEADLLRLREPLEALAHDLQLAPMHGLDIGRAAARVAERLAAVEKVWNDARDDATRYAEALRRKNDRVGEAEQLSADFAAWRERWGRAMEAINLDGAASREAAQAAIEAWSEAPKHLSELRNRESRVKGMTRDLDAFDAASAQLIRMLAPDLEGAGPAERARALQKRLDQARGDAVRQAEATRRKAERDKDLEGAAAALGKAQADLAALAALTPEGADLEALRHSLQQRDHAADALESARREYLLVADGVDEEAARRDLADFDPDFAEAMVEALRREGEAADQRANEVFAELAELRRRREALEHNGGAETAMQQRRNAEEEMRGLARQWATLRIGALLVEGALERHRDMRKDPLIARAGALFSVMTGGAFAGIEQDYSEKDEPILRARRSNGALIDVEGLSEGARDQLYLALRLAYVEDYGARAEPAPFIADDLFTSFDDARTEYALTTLGEMASLVQPIVFTHHRHVVAIAEKALGPDVDVIEIA